MYDHLDNLVLETQNLAAVLNGITRMFNGNHLHIMHQEISMYKKKKA